MTRMSDIVKLKKAKRLFESTEPSFDDFNTNISRQLDQKIRKLELAKRKGLKVR